MTKKFSVLLAALSLACAASGCHDIRSDQPSSPVVSSPPPSPASPAVETPQTPRTQAVIYVVNKNAKGDQDPLMPRTIAISDPMSPARAAVSALLQAADSPVPAGTSLRGITVDSGVATLDFSRSPVNDTGGEGGQSDSLTALARTLGQFPEIRQYQIEVRGQIVKTFGEFTSDGPMDVTRPDAVQQARRPGTAAP